MWGLKASNTFMSSCSTIVEVWKSSNGCLLWALIILSISFFYSMMCIFFFGINCTLLPSCSFSKPTAIHLTKAWSHQMELALPERQEILLDAITLLYRLLRYCHIWSLYGTYKNISRVTPALSEHYGGITWKQKEFWWRPQWQGG